MAAVMHGWWTRLHVVCPNLLDNDCSHVRYAYAEMLRQSL